MPMKWSVGGIKTFRAHAYTHVLFSSIGNENTLNSAKDRSLTQKKKELLAQSSANA